MSDHVFNWHLPQLKQLLQHYSAGKLSHALLLSGLSGTGKLEFAHVLAKALLCHDSDVGARPCNKCDACHLYDLNNHPDYLELVPEDDSRVIKIEQTRLLPKFLGLTRHMGAERVVVIYPAETLNKHSMNSLLKILEEPPQNTFVLVVTHNPGLLLATIRSRCVHIKLNSPSASQTLEWLGLDNPTKGQLQLVHIAGSQPKLARQLLDANLAEMSQVWFTQWIDVAYGTESAVKIAAIWQKQEISHILLMLHGWMADLIKIKLAVPVSGQIPDENTIALQNIAQKLEITQVYDYYNKIINALRLSTRSVNQQLLLESLLLDWQMIESKRAVNGY